jgi:hypothetical protein
VARPRDLPRPDNSALDEGVRAVELTEQAPRAKADFSCHLKCSTGYYRLKAVESECVSQGSTRHDGFSGLHEAKIGDPVLLEAVARAEKGQVDADLGGGIIKQRIARPGQGKSGGYRTIVFFRRGELAVFVFGFAKSERENIDTGEEKQFKEAARHVLGLTDKQIAELVENGDFVEMNEYEHEISK